MRDTPPSSILRLQLFGSPRLARDGQVVELGRRKALALLIYLAVTGRSHSRDRLATLFWPHAGQQKARADLRRLLSVLSRALGEGWLATANDAVALRRSDHLQVDVDEFHRRLVACGTHGHPAADVCAACRAELSAAVALYGDDFLAGFSLPDCPDFDEWHYFEAESLRRHLAAALERLAQGHREQGEWEQAIDATRRRLGLDPLQEPVHRQLMQLYLQAGQQAAAIRQYRVCVEILARELGDTPAPETVALYEQIVQNRAGVLVAGGSAVNGRHVRAVPSSPQTPAPNPPPIRPPRRHNLPPQPTPFVGREEEITGILARLHDPACRLLSLVGPGGMGKSRLAIQAGQALVDSPAAADLFPLGVWWVELTPVTSPTEVIAAIAETLGITRYGDISPREQLLAYLRERSLLLVLDNFEHLLTSAELLVELLAGAPGVKLLVTSRVALNLHEEWFFPIAGMAVPTENLDGTGLEAYDAVRLFIQSARRAQPSFRFTQERAPVIRICRLVEGMPLGIELAVAWLKVFTCDAIAAEIGRNLDFLSSRLHNTPERHRSMRAVFEHSWRLLAESERDVLARLAVFRGGFRLEAASQIAGASTFTLAALVEKSLVRPAVNDRYHMHELLRQFAEEKLAESPTELFETQQRHAAYYMAFLRAREQALKGRAQPVALAEIGDDLDNVRVAWGWAVKRCDAALIELGSEGLYQFCEVRGLYQEGAELFVRAVDTLRSSDAAVTPPHTALLQHVLARCGALHTPLQRRQVAEAYLQQSLTLARELEQPAEVAYCLLYLGVMAHWTSRYAEAKELFLMSLAIGRGINDRHTMADAIYRLVEMVTYTEGYGEVQSVAMECLAICRELERPDWLAKALDVVGAGDYALGLYAESEAYYQESLAIARTIGDLKGVYNALGGLAWLAMAKGKAHYAEGIALARQGLAVARECGHRVDIESRQMILCELLIANGDFVQARKHCMAGLATAKSVGYSLQVASFTILLGTVNLGEGDLTTTRNLLLDALRPIVGESFVILFCEALLLYAGLLVKTSEDESEPQASRSKTYAVELLTLLCEHPRCWQCHKDEAAPLLSELELQLSAHAFETAKARGRSRTLKATVAEILQAETAAVSSHPSPL